MVYSVDQEQDPLVGSNVWNLLLNASKKALKDTVNWRFSKVMETFWKATPSLSKQLIQPNWVKWCHLTAQISIQKKLCQKILDLKLLLYGFRLLWSVWCGLWDWFWFWPYLQLHFWLDLHCGLSFGQLWLLPHQFSILEVHIYNIFLNKYWNKLWIFELEM